MNEFENMKPAELGEAGKQAFGKKKFQAAAEFFQKAADAYQATNDVLMSAEMMNNQSVAWLKSGEPQKSLEAVVGTIEVFQAAGDTRRQGMALANRGAALEELKRREEALQDYEESAKLLDQAGEIILRADVMRSIASIRMTEGKVTDAIMSMQDGMYPIKKPTFKQWLLKKLVFFRWRWR